MNFKIPKVLPSEFYQIRLRETGLSTRTNQRENTVLWWFGKHNVDILFLSKIKKIKICKQHIILTDLIYLLTKELIDC